MTRQRSRSGNQKKLAIVVVVFFSFILLASTVTIAVPGIFPGEGTISSPDQLTVTGTPQDRYPDVQRPQFCGVGQPKANSYVTEYRIPTLCTQPLAITTSPDGSVWFAQTNTGNIARFDQATQTFTEFENEQWDDSVRSSMWGMDYADGYIWYTDDANDSVWRFNPADASYRQFQLPQSETELPQNLLVDGTDIILNDLLGGAMVVLDASNLEGGLVYNAAPTNIEGAMTSGFDLDASGNIWYVNWLERGAGILVGLDPDLLNNPDAGAPFVVDLPPAVGTPNGVAVDDDGNVWMADTGSSYFFMYNRTDGSFSHYITTPPDILSYGNVTGVIQVPISRPYWIKTTDQGNLVFNEETSNRIGVMDPRLERLVEYDIPSRNPFWTDCGRNPICGISQALAFDVDGTDVWFTELVENNIGHVDTSKPLPFDIGVDMSRIVLSPGESSTAIYVVQALTERPTAITPLVANTHTFLYASPHQSTGTRILEGNMAIPLDLVATEDAVPGEYKILLGAKGNSVSVSRYVTVEVVDLAEVVAPVP